MVKLALGSLADELDLSANGVYMKSSSELKKILAEFVRVNKEKYDENWKELLAKEMTAQMMDSPIMKEIAKRLAK